MRADCHLSSWFLFPINIAIKRNSVPTNKITMSILKFWLKEIGLIKELTDTMNRILKIFEPTTFPIAISLFFLVAATMDVTNSGKEVPAAIIVKPIIFSLTPKFVASRIPLFTTNWPPTIRPAKPNTIHPHILKFDLC